MLQWREECRTSTRPIFPLSFGTSGIIFTTKRRNSPKQSPLSTKKTFEGNIKDCAPARRADTGKLYFVGHDGQISSPGGGRNSNQFEEHLAIALWNLKEAWPHPGGGSFRLLHYQFPLKAKQADKGIGKVDLRDATDQGRLIGIELKVKPEKRSGGSDARGDTPLRALMEGLRYAAIVEANLDVKAREAGAIGYGAGGRKPTLGRKPYLHSIRLATKSRSA